jgi:TnpA family transposase
MRLLGFDYRPQRADLPDAELWRISAGADYGPLSTTARGRIDLGRVRAHWPDLLRLVGSGHTGAAIAHDVLRMRPTAVARPSSVRPWPTTGGSSRPLRVLSYVDQAPVPGEPGGVQGMRNLQEGRHDLARHVFHRIAAGTCAAAYHEGMEEGRAPRRTRQSRAATRRSSRPMSVT